MTGHTPKAGRVTVTRRAGRAARNNEHIERLHRGLPILVFYVLMAYERNVMQSFGADGRAYEIRLHVVIPTRAALCLLFIIHDDVTRVKVLTQRAPDRVDRLWPLLDFRFDTAV
ncbi:hypothetical protein EVAR_20049_1 [Eumeta japonica]|uniref:Uncharacterized protein n=1 Tax=Eumeta variegata TaxID=151549 RepID=A0A4C1UHY6_EUMVA|nr:hypothetical protein EVAR_20049_1 [Eumeta japonica]